jgi:DNA-binding IclR family transcriptional regulator
MEKLANRFNETVSLAYLHDDRIHVLASMDSFHEIRMSNKPGRVLPPHCSAMGKAIAAFQGRALSDRILEVYGLTRRTDATITDRQQLFQQFEEIRATGIAYDREESNTGGLCIGAAIRPPDHQGARAGDSRRGFRSCRPHREGDGRKVAYLLDPSCSVLRVTISTSARPR